ncbi:PHB depolymerase family esterase [Actinomycetospora sp. TBRC 11914]|uniref:PHB depolymerase family esterase n=1 Tax=Actinomycetospora sp. TBRC 11914 TaxID=2729387 RepID=UPI00145FA6A9|nr:PHB depolymerase family esterase [Actinomycetospora sp. TBRC 11914]NMO92927.1 alpha/beta hydrolase [Actinomycetospora sp. TBRC 11914]
MSEDGADTRVLDPEEFYRNGATPFVACQADQRFSYALHVPGTHRTTTSPLPLLVVVHGTARTAERYRDALAGFAETHGCVVLAPLFPAGIGDPDDLHRFKFLVHDDLRFDRVLLAMVDEVAARYRVDADRFLLHGFSGGGQFTHRFLYLHPERLAAASVGAPGRVTMLDPARPWWIGTADVADRFGREIDLDALRRVAVQLVVGADDVETWEINNPGGRNWMPGADAAGTTRVARLRALHANLAAHGVDARLDLVPGVGHQGARVLPTVERFFADVLAAR